MRLQTAQRISQFVTCLAAAVAVQLAARADDRGARSNFKDLDAIEAVQSGRSDTANPAWWGFDPGDATTAVQAAIDSGADKVVIPYMGMDWVVRPLTLVSDQEIVFEPGVVVTAKQGSFRGERDALVSGTGIRNVTITGYGAVLRMRKADYAAQPYAPSGSRHVLALYGVEDVHVAGLTLQSAGGDGVHVGPTWDSRRMPCKDVVIEDCVCNDNQRQGMGIVSGRNIVVENCTFRNTRGTSPESGLDVEPASARDVVSGVLIRNCVSINNEGTGFYASLTRLNSTSEPVSLRFENCRVLDTRQSGFRAFLKENANPGGLVEFINCTSEGSDYAGTMVVWNVAAQIKLRYDECKWRRSALRSSQSPVDIQLHGTGGPLGGGVEFDNCYVYDDKKRNPVRFVDLASTGQSTAVSGDIHYINGEIDSTGEFGTENLPQLTVTHSKRQQ
jgi:hypothetical protein